MARVSAEVRWFLPAASAAAAAFERWFGAVDSESTRTDVYAAEKSAELGVKTRGETDGLEIKALVDGAAAKADLGNRVASVQIWTKVASSGLSLPSETRTLTKRRRLRTFDRCNMEWTQVVARGEAAWWTFGFEATSVESLLRTMRAIDATMPGRPELGDEWLELSYPAWLALTSTRRS